jgi:hypothetical protein
MTNGFDPEADITYVQSTQWSIRARILPDDDHDYNTLRTVKLSVSYGPEVEASFYPQLPMGSEDPGSLCSAFSKAATEMGLAIQEDEARSWIENHKQLFVVVGDTGIEGRRIDWPVKAFLNRDRADAFLEAIQKWCQEKGICRDGNNVGKVTDPTGIFVKCPLDPNFRIYGDVAYRVVEIDIDMCSPRERG